METQLKNLEEQAISGLANISSENELIDYKNTILGKNGSLTIILKGLKDLSPEERGKIGTLANTLRDNLNTAFDNKKIKSNKKKSKKKLKVNMKMLLLQVK